MLAREEAEGISMSDEVSATSASPASSDVLWLFIHLPKTAGSSFRQALARQLLPEHNISIDKLRGHKKRDDAFKEMVDDFIALDKERRFAFASGHIKMNEALRIRECADRPVKFITMLRNPVDRVISEYRYQRTPVHPQHEEFCKTYPTLESFIEDPRSQNKMHRHLALKNERIEQTIDRIEKDFSIVGLLEMYPFSTRLCSHLLGVEIPSGERVRVTEKTDRNQVALEETLLTKIKSLNKFDEQMWHHFRELLVRMRDAAGPELRADGDARQSDSKASLAAGSPRKSDIAVATN